MTYTVKQARVLCDKTQQEMAHLMGIHRNTYQRIELNPDLATVSQAKKISAITGIPIAQIFFSPTSTECKVNPGA